MIDIFKALSEHSRLRILALLLHSEACVCEIEASLEMTQSNASRHLTLLKKAGILASYKKAQWIYYFISDDFKKNHQELWLYLVHNLPQLPEYASDQNAQKAYRATIDCK